MKEGSEWKKGERMKKRKDGRRDEMIQTRDGKNEEDDERRNEVGRDEKGCEGRRKEEGA